MSVVPVAFRDAYQHVARRVGFVECPRDYPEWTAAVAIVAESEALRALCRARCVRQAANDLYQAAALGRVRTPRVLVGPAAEDYVREFALTMAALVDTATTGKLDDLAVRAPPPFGLASTPLNFSIMGPSPLFMPQWPGFPYSP